MKVVIAADLAPQKVGSLERAVFHVADILRGQGHDVKVWFSGEISDEVYDYFKCRGDRMESGIGNLTDRQAQERWLRMFERERPDSIWLHFFPIVGSFIRRLRKVAPEAMICSTERVSRGYPKPSLIRSLRRRIRARLSSGCIDQHIAVSKFVAERLHSVDFVPSPKICTIYNGIDVEVCAPLPTWETSGSYLAAVAFMRPEKGILVLLKALAILKAQGRVLDCKIVGIGPELESYRRFARDYDLHRVEFLGKRDDVPVILRHAMMTIVPSLWSEAFSNAAAESQSAGVPVIASAIGGLCEVVDHGVTGLLIAPDDPVALANTIRELADDESRRRKMGTSGRLRALRMFDLRDRAEDVVGRLLAKRCVSPNS